MVTECFSQLAEATGMQENSPPAGPALLFHASEDALIIGLVVREGWRCDQVVFYSKNRSLKGEAPRKEVMQQ
jgi:hypothetical protein